MPRVAAVLVAVAALLQQLVPQYGRGQEVVATVDQQQIYDSDVHRELKRALKDRTVDMQMLKMLQAQTITRLIDRHLIFRYLEATPWGANQQEVDLRVEQIKQQLEARQRTWDQYLEQTGHTEESLRQQLSWRLGWQRYLDEKMTAERLRRYFNSRRRQFDGTRLRVAHILIRADTAEGESEDTANLECAREIAAAIAAKEFSFAEAARLHSAGPSAKDGGDLGLISRHRPMPESFSRAAFQLEKDQVSEPVRTRFGVHLIQCLEIEPGKREFDDVRPQVAASAARYLFDRLARRNRRGVTIMFTGAMPHFRPGSTKLVDAQRQPAPDGSE